MLGFRPTFWPTLMAVPAVLFMLGLGVWQVQRLHWKEQLIATIDQRIAAPPVALPTGDSLDVDAWVYRRVKVTGQFLHEREIHLLAYTERGNLGYHVITPLARQDGGYVLVDRGWVPTDKADPASRAAGQVAGTVTIEGVVRRGWAQGWFVPDNNVARNQWFYGDLAAMAASAKVSAPPILLEAGAAANPGGFPIGGQTQVTLPNNHLQYAITWFGMALALAVIYVVYHRNLAAEAKP